MEGFFANQYVPLANNEEFDNIEELNTTINLIPPLKHG